MASVLPRPEIAEITDRDDPDHGEMNFWNITITVFCIIAVGASVGYSAFRPSK
jgi:hypothetical protein